MVPDAFHRTTSNTSVTVEQTRHACPRRRRSTKPQLPVPIKKRELLSNYTEGRRENPHELHGPRANLSFFGLSIPTQHLLFQLRTIQAVTRPATNVPAVTFRCTAPQIARFAQILTRSTLGPRHVRPCTHVAIYTLGPRQTLVIHTGAPRKETCVASLFIHDATRLARAFCA